MRPARFQFAFSCRRCGKAALLETALLPYLSQSVVDIGYDDEPCRFRDSAHCLYWFEARITASRLPADVADALAAQVESREVDRTSRPHARQSGERSGTMIKAVK